MKFSSEDHWQKMAEDLTKDGEPGQWFLKCVQRWGDLAEEVLKNHPDHTPVDAIRQSLAPLEEEVGDLSVGWMAQLLCVILLHWEKGEEVSAALSALEMKMVLECFSIKLSELQKQASEQAS